MRSTHVLLTDGDLSSLELVIGHDHPLCTRFRDALAELENPLFEKYRAAAMASARDGEIEVDAGAVVSHGSDGGAYVMAWLWISDDEAGVDEESAP